MRQLRARWPVGYWLCAYQASEAALRKDVYEQGLELQTATVQRVVFERLVKERPAEMVAGLPSFGAGIGLPVTQDTGP